VLSANTSFAGVGTLVAVEIKGFKSPTGNTFTFEVCPIAKLVPNIKITQAFWLLESSIIAPNSASILPNSLLARVYEKSNARSKRKDP
jgi:hypothetical protein